MACGCPIENYLKCSWRCGMHSILRAIHVRSLLVELPALVDSLRFAESPDLRNHGPRARSQDDEAKAKADDEVKVADDATLSAPSDFKGVQGKKPAFQDLILL